MNSSTSSGTLSKPTPGQSSKIPDGLMQFLGTNPDGLLAAKMAIDFLLSESSPAPADAEYIYKAFSTQLEMGADYTRFKHHYLHAYLLKNYEGIKDWLKSLELDEGYTQRIKFWQLASRLMYEDAIAHNTAPTLSNMIRSLVYLPSILQRAFPAIQDPTVKRRFRQSL